MVESERVYSDRFNQFNSLNDSITALPQLPLHLPEAHDEGVQDAEDAGDTEAVPEDVAAMLVGGERNLCAGEQIQLLRFLSCRLPEQQRGRGDPRCQKTGQRFHGEYYGLMA